MNASGGAGTLKLHIKAAASRQLPSVPLMDHALCRLVLCVRWLSQLLSLATQATSLECEHLEGDNQYMCEFCASKVGLPCPSSTTLAP